MPFEKSQPCVEVPLGDMERPVESLEELCFAGDERLLRERGENGRSALFRGENDEKEETTHELERGDLRPGLGGVGCCRRGESVVMSGHSAEEPAKKPRFKRARAVREKKKKDVERRYMGNALLSSRTLLASINPVTARRNSLPGEPRIEFRCFNRETKQRARRTTE
jgi:hypothetical protein